MDLILKGRNLRLNDRVEAYAHKRLAKLPRFTRDPGSMRVELELFEEQNPKIEERFRAAVHLIWHDTTLHGEERASDTYAAIDKVADLMYRRLRRELDRSVQSRHGGKPADRKRIAELIDATYPSIQRGDAETSNQGATSMDIPEIHRLKQFNVGPMTVEEAALQMSLVGHDFFVFVDSDTDSTSVLYRRNDGSLGLIEPALHEVRKGA